MKFEERISLLCSQALAAKDEADVGIILAGLRLELHRRIEDLRSALLSIYPNPLIGSRPAATDAQKSAPEVIVDRGWREIVHEIAGEENPGKALLLVQELNAVLQRQSAESTPRTGLEIQ